MTDSRHFKKESQSVLDAPSQHKSSSAICYQEPYSSQTINNTRNIVCETHACIPDRLKTYPGTLIRQTTIVGNKFEYLLAKMHFTAVHQLSPPRTDPHTVTSTGITQNFIKYQYRTPDILRKSQSVVDAHFPAQIFKCNVLSRTVWLSNCRHATLSTRRTLAYRSTQSLPWTANPQSKERKSQITEKRTMKLSIKGIISTRLRYNAGSTSGETPFPPPIALDPRNDAISSLGSIVL